MKLDDRIAYYVGMIEDKLESVLSLDNIPQKKVLEAMRYSATGGGKRLRGIFVLEFCRISGGNIDAALPYACAIEMIHAYSLIHDDLPCMDNDDLRRGKPTNHKVYGEAMAVLAGDGLLNSAFELALANNQLSDTVILRLLREMSNASGVYGMIGGQCIDIEAEGNIPDLNTLINMHTLKTGALIRASCRMGCIAAGADEDKIAAADRFATKLGLAFQIRDDMLDIEGDSAILGKAVHADEKQQKTTYPTLLSMERCRVEVERLTSEAVTTLEVFSDRGFLTELAYSLADRNK